MQKNAIALHGRFVLSSNPYVGPGPIASHAVVLNQAIAAYGYTLSEEAARAVSSLHPNAVKKLGKEIFAALTELTGQPENYNVLFARFPHETPDQHAYLRQRIAYFMTVGGVPPGRGMHLHFNKVGRPFYAKTSTVEFDTSEFGVDPMTQFAVPGVRAQENVRDAHVQFAAFKVLEVAGPAMASEWVTAYLGRGSSLSMQERDFIEELRPIVSPHRVDQVFRENLPILHSFFRNPQDRQYIASLVSSATDALRIAVWMSDRKADLSLAEPTKFRLSTGERKEVLRILDRMRNPEEDMLRRRERWLRLGEEIRPGSEKNRNRFPNAARAFSMLRNDKKAIPSLYRVLEAGLRPGADAEKQRAALEALSTRPGEVIRRLEWMLRRVGEDALPYIGQAIERSNPRLLTKLMPYLRERMDGLNKGLNTGTRAFPIKGKSNRFKIVSDNRPPLRVEMLQAVLDEIQENLKERLSHQTPMGKVWIDPELYHRVLPWNRRGDTASSENVTKGSAYKCDEAPVLRLFTWWKGNFDVDLSAVLYDEDWDQLESIGFYNTHDRDRVFVHSGDIQNAPEGAAEFIDVNRERLQKQYPTARWLAMSLISFRGDGFNTFPAHAGFMGRDSLRTGRRFEPSEVALKFDLDAPTTNILTGVWDIVENRYIPADIALNASTYGTARSSTPIQEAAKQVALARRLQLTLGEIARLNAEARGQIVENRDDADIVLSPATFNVETAERWLDAAEPVQAQPKAGPAPR